MNAGNKTGRLLQPVLLVMGAIISAATSVPAAQSSDVPTFRKGMWLFERTLARPDPAPSKTLRKTTSQTTRCVDPTQSMRATFASPNVGSCRSAKVEKDGNRYVFPMRCDYLGPVRTEITVESDAAYTEVNALMSGATPLTETIVARRIGDCAKD
jgi:hypothetical protein